MKALLKAAGLIALLFVARTVAEPDAQSSMEGVLDGPGAQAAGRSLLALDTAKVCELPCGSPVFVALTCPQGASVLPGAFDGFGNAICVSPCPKGFAPSVDEKKCEPTQCKIGFTRTDTDGTANGIICKGCPVGYTFIQDAVTVNGTPKPGCYKNCAARTQDTFGAPIPICCTKCAPGCTLVAGKANQCRCNGVNTPRNCPRRAFLSNTVTVFPRTRTVPAICPKDTLAFFDGGQIKCFQCSPNGTPYLFQPPGLVSRIPRCRCGGPSACPSTTTRFCDPYCWNPSPNFLSVLAVHQGKPACTAFLDEFKECIQKCPTPTGR